MILSSCSPRRAPACQVLLPACQVLLLLPPALAANVPQQSRPPIRILHFNDVYNIEEAPTSPCAGASRFAAKLKALREEHEPPALVMFSGDLFNPSLLSTVNRGKQMVEVINLLGVDVACHGNHDYDFGVPALQQRAHECSTFSLALSSTQHTRPHALSLSLDQTSRGCFPTSSTRQRAFP
jgi:2',3'-cyclic-nucleotide 2'-phosphodiesterase (5'-nucleotidase family)